MSFQKPTESEKKQLNFSCRYCRASRGHWCRKADLYPAARLHKSRRTQAQSSGQIPLDVQTPRIRTRMFIE